MKLCAQIDHVSLESKQYTIRGRGLVNNEALFLKRRGRRRRAEGERS